MGETADRLTEIAAITRRDRHLIACARSGAAAIVDTGDKVTARLGDRADVELLRGDVPDPDEGW